MQESPLEAQAEVSAEDRAAWRIDYTVSRGEAIAAMQKTTQIMLRSVRWGTAVYLLTAASVVCGIAIGMGYMELINGYIGRNWRLQWLIAVAFLAVCLLTIWGQRLRAARIDATCVDGSTALGPQVLTLGGDGLTHTGGGITAHMPWATLRQVTQGDDKILIIFGNFSFVVIPSRAFSDAAQRDAWLAALRRRVAGGVRAASSVQGSTQATDVPPAPQVDSAAGAGTAVGFGVTQNLRAGARLAFFRRVRPVDFVVTAEAFMALAALSLLVALAFAIAHVGLNGRLNVSELPRALLFVPLMLLFGVVAARATADRALLLALPVALVAASVVAALMYGLATLLMAQKLFVVTAQHWLWLFYVQIAWWSAIVVLASWRFSPSPAPAAMGVPRHSGRTPGIAMLGLALLVTPIIWLPRGQLWMPADDPAAKSARRKANEKMFALADEKGFYAQHEALQRALSALRPERPGIADVYSLTAGLYASEDVFMKEVKLIDALMRKRFDAEGRSLVLLNNAGTVHDYPLASATSLSAALKHIGGLMNRDEDVLVLYVSSHGSEKHDLSVDFWPLRLQPVNPAGLKRALDASRIKWKVIVVSACYSGGFVEPLKDDNTLIITASSATKTSFGCGNESDSTYLAKALFDEALRNTYSFETAFEQARKTILEREQAQEHTPSDPQIFVGAAIRDKLLQVEQRLSGLKP